MRDVRDVRGVRVWRFDVPRLCISSAPVGGGIGLRSWIINAQVPIDYARTDLEAHVRELATVHRCEGDGVGMLTAANLHDASIAEEDAVEVCATVGVTLPTWAAASDGVATPWRPGTVNIVAQVPVRLSDAALVNAVMTVTEAKAQALFEAGVPGTGTASDALCVACDPHGTVEAFAGPRSRVGAPLARAVHAAVRRGVRL
jgi:adenosylcobinamide amidohydrolase